MCDKLDSGLFKNTGQEGLVVLSHEFTRWVTKGCSVGVEPNAPFALGMASTTRTT